MRTVRCTLCLLAQEVARSLQLDFISNIVAANQMQIRLRLRPDNSRFGRKRVLSAIHIQTLAALIVATSTSARSVTDAFCI